MNKTAVSQQSPLPYYLNNTVHTFLVAMEVVTMARVEALHQQQWEKEVQNFHALLLPIRKKGRGVFLWKRRPHIWSTVKGGLPTMRRDEAASIYVAQEMSQMPPYPCDKKLAGTQRFSDRETKFCLSVSCNQRRRRRR